MLGEYSMNSQIALVYVKFAILMVPALAVGFSLWRQERQHLGLEAEMRSQAEGLARAA